MRYYLDYNASAPILKDVKDYIISTLEITGNPSSIHHTGREAKKIIEKARERIASFIKTEKNNIIFTSGATEANNFIIKNFNNVIASNIEHESIINNPKIKKVRVTSEGYVDLEHLENIIKNTNQNFQL